MASITTRAAIVRKGGDPWEVTELELDEPRAGEVLVHFMATGLCHSDEHIREGGDFVRYPLVGGHEGAGVVEAVGPGVTRVGVGDHIVTSFIPVCGHCRYCSTGHQNLCDGGLNATTGMSADGTFRFHEGGEYLGGMCQLGTFAQRSVLPELSCVPVEQDIPFDVAALVACGVTTGFGSSVYAAGVRAGDTVVVIGIGGVGINAVQGARYAGAKHVIAIDPVPFKLEMAAKLGATFVATGVEEARAEIVRLTRGQLADEAVVTVGVMEAEVMHDAVSLVGKNGVVVATAVGRQDVMTLAMSTGPLTGYQRSIKGALFGAANPLYDIPKLLGLYKAGHLKLDELITRRYRLEEINEGYADMLEGRNIRGVVIHD